MDWPFINIENHKEKKKSKKMKCELNYCHKECFKAIMILIQFGVKSDFSKTGRNFFKCQFEKSCSFCSHCPNADDVWLYIWSDVMFYVPYHKESSEVECNMIDAAQSWVDADELSSSGMFIAVTICSA